MADQTIKLAVGGPVQAKYGTYLPRPTDRELLSACQAGKFAYVLACRQIGKSSLMFETSEKLSQMGIKTALIDLNSIGLSVEADSWYFSLIDEIARKLGLEVNVQSWWEKRPRLSTLNQRFLQFLREVVLKEISGPVVIFVDEIDMTLGLGFTDDLFAAIRSVHNDRAQHSAYRRLTFVLLGVATPDELIKDHTRTPFNIGQEITLDDFTKEECQPFRLALEARYPDQGRSYFDQLYDWTGGHPYLTQKLCDGLLKADVLELEMAHTALIDPLVRKLFLAPEARGEDNIQFIQTRVVGDPCAQDMLRIYKRILENQEPVPDDEQSPPINRLKLYGLVVARNDQLEVRNKLYRQAFNLSWANEMLAGVKLGLPGKYKILQEIGQGGFSTVYLAQLQESGQTQSIALKVLKSASVKDVTQVKRFKQEARAVAKLKHPNIIRILETSEDEEPSYIAMEYISSGTLRDRLKFGPLTRAEAMDIVRQIGSALSYAHEQDIIHRDVNPNNILLDTTSDPLRPRPVLTDFGLVKLLSWDGHTQISSTAIMGTFDYMAPEQWKQETPTAATDVYALAITFFEILSGKRPFEAFSLLELMDKHTNEPMPLLSGVASEIGAFFDDVLIRATAKEPANRFNTITAFIEALESANARAEEVERTMQQNQAAKMVEATESYIQKGRYNPDRALAMVEAALETYPGYLEALKLRGKIRLQQGQLEMALEDYKYAYEQEKGHTSEISLNYLDVLSRIAETYWERQQFPEAVKHYQTIQQIVIEGNDDIGPAQEIWQRVRARLIEFYYHEGDTAYASGHSDNLDKSISTLEEIIRRLKALNAVSETENLLDKLKRLKVIKYENIIKTSQMFISEINTRDSQTRFASEDIFQRYTVLDETYQVLIELEPENRLWSENRRKKLKEQVETRCIFAVRALNKLEPDYESALRHYNAILDLEQSKYPGLAEELHFNLHEEIIALRTKVDYDGKYNDIRRLLEDKDYPKALEHLDREFISTGNYEHRDVARWLWGLVYAKQHEWNFPPEWESMSGFTVLSKRLVNVERGRIQQLKELLEPWSKTKISETVRAQIKTLSAQEEEVKAIEAMLTEAVTHGVAETPEIEQCHTELEEIKTRIHTQRDVFYQIDVIATSQHVEAWLQKIEDIEALLQTGNPIKDIPEFFSRSDEEQHIIEKDTLFEMLRGLNVTGAEIKQTIVQLKFRIRDRLVRILIDDVSRRDEELATMSQEFAETSTTLTRVQAEAVKTQAELSILRPRFDSLEQQSKRFKQQYEINKYVIPVSLVVAVIVGGFIAPQLEKRPELSTLMWITLVLLIAYFIYYIWIYYLPQRRNK